MPSVAVERTVTSVHDLVLLVLGWTWVLSLVIQGCEADRNSRSCRHIEAAVSVDGNFLGFSVDGNYSCQSGNHSEPTSVYYTHGDPSSSPLHICSIEADTSSMTTLVAWRRQRDSNSYRLHYEADTLPTEPIRAPFSFIYDRLPNEGGVYLFSRGRYLEYDDVSGVEKTTGPVARLGLGGDVTVIDAAFRVPGVQNLVIITSGHDFYRYNTSRGDFRRRIGHGNLQEVFGIPSSVDAGFSSRHQMTVIKGCHLWTLDVRRPSSVFEREPRSLTDWGIPCDLDSALTMSHDLGPILLIKDHRMWKLYRPDHTNGEEDEVEGPFHTDDLNICSWFLCGEANFTRPYSAEDVMACNGDVRLCPLRLDQVTLSGLHNAGAGFSHGFGMFNCWVKNHGNTIYQQLLLGIRHLDIDPCYDTCGYLGTCHSYFCGGSICSILKQIRRFLIERPDQVVTVNFNHEIIEPRKVFRELTRQLKTQMRPLLNSAFRDSGETQWPTLQHSIGHNKRLFVIYAYIIQDEPHASHYRRNRWIHTEHWYGSTWREIELTPGCAELVTTTRRMCYHRQHRQLIEISTVVTPTFTTCIDDIASTCRPRLLETLRMCEDYRFRHGKSPNVLLVDYPEVTPQEVTSVFHAVYLQNVRNILHHRASQCSISIDAAVRVNRLGFIFSGSKLVIYDFDMKMQIDIRELPGHLHRVDAAYAEPSTGSFTVVKDCVSWQIDRTSLSNLTEGQTMEECPTQDFGTVDAAVVWNGLIHLFQGCTVLLLNTQDGTRRVELSDMGLPCDLDAVMTSQDGVALYAFKDDLYWRYGDDDDDDNDDDNDVGGNRQAVPVGYTKDWNVDVVWCAGA